VKIDFVKIDRLQELESYFITQIREQKIHLLGDLVVAKNQLDELASLVHYMFLVKLHAAIKEKYSLSTSIFLVWCSIYDYKEGTFWDPIFFRLKITYNLKIAEFLGETFLATLKRYGLQQISTPEKTKKYMTPILMHGYIGDQYTGKLLDYLNAVYTSYLKYDVSEQALERLWSDIFILEHEQISIKGDIEALEEKEQNLKADFQRYEVPANLRDMSRTILMEHENNAYQLIERIQDIHQKLREIDQELQRYQKVEKELVEYQRAIEEIQQIGPSSWLEDVPEQLIQLQQEFVELIKQKLDYFQKQNNELTKEENHYQSQSHIESEKVKEIKTNILTLGKGREDEGWSLLYDLQENKIALNHAQTQLTQKRSLVQMEEQFKNTSLKQILTTSLTHLAIENQPCFRLFIKSTLKMIDGVLRKQQVDETHRMHQPICQWLNQVGKEKKELTERESPTNRPLKNSQVRSQKANRVWRLVRPKLRQPSLVYDSTGRNLSIFIPEQEFLVPKDFQEKPSFYLGYPDGQEKIDVLSIIERNTMVTQERQISITRPEVEVLAFRWLNISEYWPISLEPVMVFNEKKQLMTNSRLPNGFYFILAQINWRTDSLHIIDQYVGGPEGYQVYEAYLEESKITFWTESPNNCDITLQSSQFSGIVLKGVEPIPGLFVEEMPVCYGAAPIMTIGDQIDIQELIFSLFYQGELLLQRPMRDILDQYGQKISAYATELELQKIMDQKYPPHVEKVQISITDNQGQEVFGRSFCQVRGVSFSFRTSEIIVKIPTGARLKYPAARQEGTTYYIAVEDQPWSEVEIYFNRIGWKRFQIETPVVEYHLANTDGQNLDLPFCMLSSEATNLKQTSVHWSTNSSLPEKVILFDEDEELVSTFNLKNGRASAQLKSFYDILQDLSGSKKIYFRWEGKTRSSPNYLLSELFDKVEVVESAIFQTERDSDNLFEINIKLNFCYKGQLMIRVYESRVPAKVLIDQGITDHTFYLYVNKEDAEASLLSFELYYLERVESIFGTEEKEVICWTREEERILKKAVIKEVIKRGLVIEAFSYNQERYLLKDLYFIEQITIEPKHFEEEELFKGIINNHTILTEVYFYLDIKTQKLPFLIDTDYDGVQYHPATGELFWEYRSDREIMAPLDDLEYRIKEEDSL